MLLVLAFLRCLGSSANHNDHDNDNDNGNDNDDGRDSSVQKKVELGPLGPLVGEPVGTLMLGASFGRAQSRSETC